MLVLSRKLEESIVIGNDIKIKVVSIEKGVVKLGIEAPKNISIVREELLEQIKDSNLAAAKDIKTDDLSLLSSILKK